jgi:MraZ protein
VVKSGDLWQTGRALGLTMLLTGTFRRSVDEKQRVSVPKRLRSGLESAGKHAALYLAPGTDGSLALYTEPAFEALGDRLAAASPTGQEVRDFGRLFYAMAQSVEMDTQGRIRIPQELFALAKLDQEVMMIGVRDKVEIWDRARWESYLGDKQPRYDEIAERAFGG